MNMKRQHPQVKSKPNHQSERLYLGRAHCLGKFGPCGKQTLPRRACKLGQTTLSHMKLNTTTEFAAKHLKSKKTLD